MERAENGNVDKHNNARGDSIDHNEVITTIDNFLKSYYIELQELTHINGIIHDNSNYLNIVFDLYQDRNKKFIEFVTIMKKENFKSDTGFKFYYV